MVEDMQQFIFELCWKNNFSANFCPLSPCRVTPCSWSPLWLNTCPLLFLRSSFYYDDPQKNKIQPAPPWYGACVRGPKSNGVNNRRTAVVYHFFTYDELEKMQQEPKHNNNRHKHWDHGGRAALLSSDVELMDQRDPTCRRPIHGIGWGRGKKISVANY